MKDQLIFNYSVVKPSLNLYSIKVKKSLNKRKTMKPKEKAQEIVFKYLKINLPWKEAKMCSYYVVDEVLQFIDSSMQGFLDADLVSYWRNVKNEIEKL